MNTIAEGFENEVSERTKDLQYITNLPKEGLSKKNILEVTDANLGLGKKVLRSCYL